MTIVEILRRAASPAVPAEVRDRIARIITDLVHKANSKDLFILDYEATIDTILAALPQQPPAAEPMDFADSYTAARRQVSDRLADEIVSRNAIDDKMKMLYRPEGESDAEFVRRIVATYIALASPPAAQTVREAAAQLLERRASGYAGRVDSIFNGRIMADELRANAREIRALAADSGKDQAVTRPDGYRGKTE